MFTTVKILLSKMVPWFLLAILLVYSATVWFYEMQIDKKDGIIAERDREVNNLTTALTQIDTIRDTVEVTIPAVVKFLPITQEAIDSLAEVPWIKEYLITHKLTAWGLFGGRIDTVFVGSYQIESAETTVVVDSVAEFYLSYLGYPFGIFNVAVLEYYRQNNIVNRFVPPKSIYMVGLGFQSFWDEWYLKPEFGYFKGDLGTKGEVLLNFGDGKVVRGVGISVIKNFYRW